MTFPGGRAYRAAMRVLLFAALLAACSADATRPSRDAGSDAATDAFPLCQPGSPSLDCDGDDSNGCETPILTNPNNCGACGVRCTQPGLTRCVSGICGP